ncbi:AraC family transcriptional regulator [uncultured Arthrobacter sp.]|uniref:AraC family transcriptional regulator n=1 Tax=uncultured Arthrobacter sp. TaxID=114050 RepID=UPI00260CA7CC|nr:AraC family transcriptional regulator [uncultured Arthrobacter sp.]
MDPLTHFLDGPHARRAFALRVEMSPPWSLGVRDEAPLTVMAVLSGLAWLEADGNSFALGVGDIALVRGPKPYVVTDEPGREPNVVIFPGQECRTIKGEPVELSMTRGIRTWGNTVSGQTTMLIGAYESDAEIGSAVTAALPRTAVVPAGTVNAALVQFLAAEVATDAPGQGSVIDRMLDVLLVQCVRAWTAAHPERATGWLAASADTVVGQALELLHELPAEPWTLDALAGRLNVSRATLAARFRTVVGEPPMTYLTNWRMLLASELLADPHRTTARIAGEIGYGSPFALSTAFKRRFGVSPTEYRRRKYAAPA